MLVRFEGHFGRMPWPGPAARGPPGRRPSGGRTSSPLRGSIAPWTCGQGACSRRRAAWRAYGRRRSLGRTFSIGAEGAGISQVARRTPPPTTRSRKTTITMRASRPTDEPDVRARGRMKRRKRGPGRPGSEPVLPVFSWPWTATCHVLYARYGLCPICGTLAARLGRCNRPSLSTLPRPASPRPRPRPCSQPCQDGTCDKRR